MRWRYIVLAPAALLITGCATSSSCISIVPPSVNLTGEKTSVERQIVGDYEEIEKDAWAISSVKTSVDGSGGEGNYAVSDPELLKAIKVREFHRDRIRVYKNEGALGEGNDGLIVYRPVGIYERDRDARENLLLLVANENAARRTIFERSVAAGKEKASEEDVRRFAGQFAREQARTAQKNDWIQEVSGKWKRK